MATVLPESGMSFSFPADWVVLKFDDSKFHKKFWNSFAAGSKGVDFIAAYKGTIWLIEVKDYRQNSRQKPSEIFDEIAMKVRDSIAGLHVLSLRDSQSSEQETAKAMTSSCVCIRVVLHLEQPKKPSKLFPQTIDWKTAKDQIRRVMRTVDPHCVVGNKLMLNGSVAWTVS